MRQQNLDPEGVAQWFVRNGTPEQMQFGMKMLEAAREEKMFRQAFPQPQAAGAQNAMIPAPTAMPATPTQPAAAQPAVQMVGGKTREQLTQLLAHPQKNVRDAAQQMLEQFPKPARDFAPTEIERLQDAIAQLPAGDPRRGPLEARIQMLTTRPEPAQTTIKLPPQQNAFEAALGGAQAKKLMEDKTAAEDAVSIIDTVRQGKELLRGPIITGFGAEFLTSVGSALNQAGISFAEDAVANTQAFAGNMAQNVGKLIKLFGAGTGLSDADRAYAEKMAGGKVTLDKAALDKILDINERAARNVIRRHNKNVEAANVTTNIPLGVEMPAEITLPAVRSPSATSTRPATGNLTPDEQRELEALRRRFGRPAQ